MRHPLLKRWIVLVADSEDPSGRVPLCGRFGAEVFLLAFRDLPGARRLSEQAGGGQPVLCVQANLQALLASLARLGASGVVVDWVPGQPTIEEAHALSA